MRCVSYRSMIKHAHSKQRASRSGCVWVHPNAHKNPRPGLYIRLNKKTLCPPRSYRGSHVGREARALPRRPHQRIAFPCRWDTCDLIVRSPQRHRKGLRETVATRHTTARNRTRAGALAEPELRHPSGKLCDAIHDSSSKLTATDQSRMR